MCIFSHDGRPGGTVRVAGTRIFARCGGDEQWLAYEMTFGSARDVAMVLPLPVVRGSGEQAVRFLDLSGYDTFFDDLARLFPEPRAQFAYGGPPQASRQPTLVVHRVGDFEASYVPTIADFARLDRRFRLPDAVWNALPAYQDFGFAVFKLFAAPRRGLLARLGLRKPAPAPTGETKRVHPMALAFRTRSPDRAYFPTVHVHDGAVHAEAQFDHALYCQRADAPAAVHGRGWEQAESPVSTLRDSKGVLAPAVPCFRRRLAGALPNRDVYAE